MSAKISGLSVSDDGRILNPAVGKGAVHSTALDGESVEVSSGVVKVKDRGVKPAKMHVEAGFAVREVFIASDDAAGIFSWENDTGVECLVTVRGLYVTTGTSGACTADFGTEATEISSNNLFDGLDLSSTGVYHGCDSSGHGSNGGYSAKVPAGGFVTGSMATGATAGLAGWVVFDVVATPS